jgi:hypothetical protein
MTTPPNWYPDPTGTHELRYWDGTNWTEHVADRGVVSQAPLQGGAQQQQQADYSPAQGRQQYQQQPAGPVASTGSLFAPGVLNFTRHYDSFQKTFHCDVRDQAGQVLGVAAEPQSAGRTLANMFAFPVNAIESNHVTVFHPGGAPLFLVDRPGVLTSQPYVVRDPNGQPLGQISIGRRPGLILECWDTAGHYLGGAWNVPPGTGFTDGQDQEIARMSAISNQWQFGGWNNVYSIQVHRPLEGLAGPLLITAMLYVRI